MGQWPRGICLLQGRPFGGSPYASCLYYLSNPMDFENYKIDRKNERSLRPRGICLLQGRPFGGSTYASCLYYLSNSMEFENHEIQSKSIVLFYNLGTGVRQKSIKIDSFLLLFGFQKPAQNQNSRSNPSRLALFWRSKINQKINQNR